MYNLMIKASCLIFLFTSLQASEEQKQSNFSSQTIDIGIVVTDIERSLAFYKGVIGFTEKEGFKVSGKFPKLVGLTDGAPLEISVLTLGENNQATKLKLMEVESQKPTRVIKQAHIHTIAGPSYLTIMVKDVDLIMERAQKHGFNAYARSPQVLPEGLPQDICLLMLKDPDGNFVEIVGPRTKNLIQKP